MSEFSLETIRATNEHELMLLRSYAGLPALRSRARVLEIAWLLEQVSEERRVKGEERRVKAEGAVVIYVAGPFRGADAWAVEQNVRRAEEVAYAVFAAGAVALCPHTNTRFFDGALPDQVFLDATLELLRRCDGVLVLPDSERSQGTQGEIAEAQRRGMPVVPLAAGGAGEVAAAVAWIGGRVRGEERRVKGEEGSVPTERTDSADGEGE